VTSLKIIVLGAEESGKTSMLMRYTNRIFPHEFIPAIFDSDPSLGSYKENNYSLLLIDDKINNKDDIKNNKIKQMSYSNTNIFIFCFSIDNRKQLENLEEIIYEIKNISLEVIRFIIVGKKNYY
jgi:GTPase SAR1 family protein